MLGFFQIQLALHRIAKISTCVLKPDRLFVVPSGKVEIFRL